MIRFEVLRVNLTWIFMTQNCVTYTAISKAAEKYSVAILVDGCTTVDEMIHTSPFTPSRHG